MKMQTVTFLVKVESEKDPIFGFVQEGKKFAFIGFETKNSSASTYRVESDLPIKSFQNFICFHVIEKFGDFISLSFEKDGETFEVLNDKFHKEPESEEVILITNDDKTVSTISKEKYQEAVKMIGKSAIKSQHILVPYRFNYTKDNNLNDILQLNLVENEYDKNIHNEILKALSFITKGQVRQALSESEKTYVYINTRCRYKRGQVFTFESKEVQGYLSRKKNELELKKVGFYKITPKHKT